MVCYPKVYKVYWYSSHASSGWKLLKLCVTMSWFCLQLTIEVKKVDLVLCVSHVSPCSTVSLRTMSIQLWISPRFLQACWLWITCSTLPDITRMPTSGWAHTLQGYFSGVVYLLVTSTSYQTSSIRLRGSFVVFGSFFLSFLQLNCISWSCSAQITEAIEFL